jgi:hypothetical protein
VDRLSDDTTMLRVHSGGSGRVPPAEEAKTCTRESTTEQGTNDEGEVTAAERAAEIEEDGDGVLAGQLAALDEQLAQPRRIFRASPTAETVLRLMQRLATVVAW